MQQAANTLKKHDDSSNQDNDQSCYFNGCGQNLNSRCQPYTVTVHDPH